MPSRLARRCDVADVDWPGSTVVNDIASPLMLHDVAIVGAGPVGATLALALADGDLDVVVLDARAPGATLRGDRSLALSHGARLILERLGVWARPRGRCRAR